MMMSAFEAKTRFGELLERVARGEEVVITRYAKPVARIVPEGRRDARTIAAAVEGLVARKLPRLFPGNLAPHLPILHHSDFTAVRCPRQSPLHASSTYAPPALRSRCTFSSPTRYSSKFSLMWTAVGSPAGAGPQPSPLNPSNANSGQHRPREHMPLSAPLGLGPRRMARHSWGGYTAA